MYCAFPVGIQTFVMTLEGAAVALAAQGHLLALVWHAGMPADPGDQCLHYTVYDISQQQQVRCQMLVSKHAKPVL